jgi:four helix bundle protein
VRDFRKLMVWNAGRRLASEIYRITLRFPPVHRFALASQMQRAAISIVANIAEGAGRATRFEYARFLTIAFGSASELECLVLVAHDLGLVPQDLARPLIEKVIEVKKMLYGFIERLKAEG